MIESAAIVDPPVPAPKPRKRHWFQFSLRALMVGVAVFCVFGGWFGNQVRMVRGRKVMAFRPGVDPVTTEARGKLPWMRIWLGDEYYKGQGPIARQVSGVCRRV